MEETDAVRKIVPAATLLLGGRYSDCVLRFGDEERPAHRDLLREWCGAFEEGLAPERDAPKGEAVESRPSKKRRDEAGEGSDDLECARPIFTVVRERPALVESGDWPGVVDDFMRWLYGAMPPEGDGDEDEPARNPVDAIQDARNRLVLYHLARRLRVPESRAIELTRAPYLRGCYLSADAWSIEHFGAVGCKGCPYCRAREIVVSCNFAWAKSTQFKMRADEGVDFAAFLREAIEARFKVRLEILSATLRLDIAEKCLVVELSGPAVVRAPLGKVGRSHPDIMIPLCYAALFGA